MPKVQFPWLARGESVDLPDIPMAGDDELDALSVRYAKTIVLQKRSFHLQRLLAILSVKNLLERGHAQKARAAWLQALPIVEPPQSQEQYQWDEDSFEVEFDAYFRAEVEEKHNVSGFAEANRLLLERLKELEAEAKDADGLRQKDFQKERLVTDLYWRLKGQYKTVTVDGAEVPLTKENLRQAIRIPGDYHTYLVALSGVRAPASAEAERESFLEEIDEEGVKKKSSNTSESAKPSKTGSPSTSAPTTAAADS